MIGEWYWHVHHDRLCEPLREPIETRIAYIKANKSESEIETRLRLMRPVRGDIPADLAKAQADYDKAQADYDKAWADYSKTWTDYNKTWTDYDKAQADLDKARADHDKARADLDKAWTDALPAFEALHRIECPDCPWDGHTIFPPEGA